MTSSVGTFCLISSYIYKFTHRHNVGTILVVIRSAVIVAGCKIQCLTITRFWLTVNKTKNTWTYHRHRRSASHLWFVKDVRGMNSLSTECVARGMRTYSWRGRCEEPLFAAGHWNRTTTSRDIRVWKVTQKRTIFTTKHGRLHGHTCPRTRRKGSRDIGRRS